MIQPLPRRALRPLSAEDGDNGYWDARTMGNGYGQSFIIRNGVKTWVSDAQMQEILGNGGQLPSNFNGSPEGTDRTMAPKGNLPTLDEAMGTGGGKLPFGGRFLPVIGNAVSDLGYGLATEGVDNMFGAAAKRGAQMAPERQARRDARRQEEKALAQAAANAKLLVGAPDLQEQVASGALPFAQAYDMWKADRAKAAPKPLMDVAAGATVFDPNTNQAVYTAPSAAGQGTSPKDVFGFEKDLVGQYASADPVKAYSVVRDGYERVQASVAQSSGAGDMALLYGYMKMLDPGSVVRESEYATAAASGDFGEQVKGAYLRLATGERLPDSQRQEFLRSAQSIYDQVATNLSDINQQYTSRANEWGVDPSMVIRQPETYPKPGGSTTITSDAEYNALPSGTTFIAPDGTTRRKP